MYRHAQGVLEVFLVHPGGPFWASKDKGAWSIPKGELNDGESALEAAIREFHEETGSTAQGNFLELGTVKQASGKVVSAWAFEGDCNPADLISNLFDLEWPPGSGHLLAFPEIDQGQWFTLPDARAYILPSQQPLLASLSAHLAR